MVKKFHDYCSDDLEEAMNELLDAAKAKSCSELLTTTGTTWKNKLHFQLRLLVKKIWGFNLKILGR